MTTMTKRPKPIHIDFDTNNAKNYSGEKAQPDRFIVLAFKKGEFHQLVDLRCWMGRSSSANTVYASVWISEIGETGYVSRMAGGHGKASGYGYCKMSAAAISTTGEQSEFRVHKRTVVALRYFSILVFDKKQLKVPLDCENHDECHSLTIRRDGALGFFATETSRPSKGTK